MDMKTYSAMFALVSALFLSACNTQPNQEKAYSDRLDFYKMDINECVDTCLKYSVLSVPKMMFFRDGREVAERMGSASSSVLESFIKAHI